MRTALCTAVAGILVLLPALSPAPPLELERLDSDGTNNRIRIRYTIPFLPSGEGSYLVRRGVDEVSIPPASVVPDSDHLGVTINLIPAPVGPTLQPLPEKYTVTGLDVITANGTEGFSQSAAFLASDPERIREQVSAVDGLYQPEGLWVKIVEQGVSSGTFATDRIFVERPSGSPAFGLILELDDISFLASPDDLVTASGRLETDSTGNLRMIVSEPTLTVTPGRRGPRAPIIPTVKLTDQIQEEEEGTLVQMLGKVVDPRRGGTPEFTADATYILEDTAGTIEFTITGLSGLAGTPIPTGDFTLVGTVFQNAPMMPFLDGYTVAPRGEEDVVVFSSAAAWHQYE